MSWSRPESTQGDLFVLEAKQEETTVQTLILSKERFEDLAAARSWVIDHDFRADKVDETDTSFRFRQREPGDFVDGSFRTIQLDEGVTAVIGRLKRGINPGTIRPDFVCSARLSVRPRWDGEDAGRQLAFKATDGNGRLPIRILSSTPGIDEMNEIVEVDAFRSSVEKFNERPVLLAFHDMAQPVGLAPARIEEFGLVHDEAFISSAAPNIQQLVLDGVLSAASIGFIVKRAEFDDELQLMRIKDLELIEVSLVPLPANRETFVEAAKGWSAKQVEQMVQKRAAKAERKPDVKAAGVPEAQRDEQEPEIPAPALPELGPTIRALGAVGRVVADAAGSVAAEVMEATGASGSE